MNNIDNQYQSLLRDILDNGIEKKDRTGTGTISLFGRQIRHKMCDGFPLLTTKKMAWKQIVTELLWFLRGDTNIKFLLDYDCHIWDGDCFANYVRNFTKYVDSLPKCGETEFIIDKDKFINKIKTDDEFAKKWGELGRIYGAQWRRWKGFHEGQHDILKVIDGIEKHKDYLEGTDQIFNLIHNLKTNPDSRRLMVSAWNVGELDQMVLPPCHYGFQVYTRELTWNERHKLAETKYQLDDTDEELNKQNVPTRAISLMFNMRSNDVPLGLPFNLASYGLLLEIIAKEVNMIPNELIASLGDAHIYLNQIDGVREQLTREPYPLPKLTITNQVNFDEDIDEFLNSCLISDFQIEGYQCHPTIKMPLSN